MQTKAEPPSTNVSWATPSFASSMVGNSAGVTHAASTKHSSDFVRHAALPGAGSEAGVLEVNEGRNREPRGSEPGRRSRRKLDLEKQLGREDGVRPEALGPDPAIEVVGAVRFAARREDVDAAARRKRRLRDVKAQRPGALRGECGRPCEPAVRATARRALPKRPAILPQRGPEGARRIRSRAGSGR